MATRAAMWVWATVIVGALGCGGSGANAPAAPGKEEKFVELPATWPADAPIYPGSRATMKQESDGLVTVALKSSDSAYTVAHYYAAELAKHGWKLDPPLIASTSGFVGAGKGKRSCVVSVGPDDSGSLTSITVAEPPSAAPTATSEATPAAEPTATAEPATSAEPTKTEPAAPADAPQAE